MSPCNVCDRIRKITSLWKKDSGTQYHSWQWKKTSPTCVMKDRVYFPCLWCMMPWQHQNLISSLILERFLLTSTSEKFKGACYYVILCDVWCLYCSKSCSIKGDYVKIYNVIMWACWKEGEVDMWCYCQSDPGGVTRVWLCMLLERRGQAGSNDLVMCWQWMGITRWSILSTSKWRTVGARLLVNLGERIDNKGVRWGWIVYCDAHCRGKWTSLLPLWVPMTMYYLVVSYFSSYTQFLLNKTYI